MAETRLAKVSGFMSLSSIGGQLGRVKRAGTRHGDFGPAQARHGNKRAVPRHGPGSARAGLRFEVRGPAWHGTNSFFYFLFLPIFIFFFSVLGRICAKWAVPDGPTMPNGPSACLWAVPEVWPWHACRPRHSTILIMPNGPCRCRAGPGRHGWLAIVVVLHPPTPYEEDDKREEGGIGPACFLDCRDKVAAGERRERERKRRRAER